MFNKKKKNSFTGSALLSHLVCFDSTDSYLLFESKEAENEGKASRHFSTFLNH